MASKTKQPFFNAFATTAVVLIILGALALSSGAIMENIRFAKATNQIFWLVNQARAAAADQKGFASTAGEDIWNNLAILGRIASTTPHTNPWQGDLRAVTVAGGMRVETTLPAHECRRLALYFLGQNLTSLGILALDAQSYSDAAWTPINIRPDLHSHASRAVEQACGSAPYARLGLVFSIR